MRQMIWLTASLLSLLATVEASRLEELRDKILLEGENFEKEQEHGRELWWWVTSKGRQAGQVCGSRNLCEEGLECTHVGYGNRCTAQTSCLADEFEQFGREVDVEQLKQDMLQEAGTSQEEVVAAAEDSNDGFLKNEAVRSFIRTMNRHLGVFDRLDGIVRECSEQITFAPTTPMPTNVPSVAPSLTPTKAPSNAPSVAPTLVPKRTIFTGFSIEGGALVEGSLTVFWEKDSELEYPPVYVKGCVGFGPLIGGDISLVAIVAETDDPKEIQCLSTMYDVDIAAGVGVGYGIGVCMLSDPTFIYQEFKLGAGLGASASTFSVCDGEQIAEGYDDAHRL